MEPTLDDDAQKLDIESIRVGMKLVNIDGATSWLVFGFHN